MSKMKLFAFLIPLNKPQNVLGNLLKCLFLGIVYSVSKPQPTHFNWSHLLILYAILFLIPLVLSILSDINVPKYTAEKLSESLFLAAILVVFSLCTEGGIVAGILTLPYLLWCVLTSFFFFKNSKNKEITVENTIFLAFVFLVVGAIWLVFDRFDIAPLGFSVWIVRLTAAHFHYAGFALTMSLALALQYFKAQKTLKNLIFAVILGVALTAVGITTTQIFGNIFIETLAAMLMSVTAFCVGIFYTINGFKAKGIVKFLWTIGGLCLVMAMILAFLYGIRHFLPISWLNIPNMQGLHGTLNALGFGNLILWGCFFIKGNTEFSSKKCDSDLKYTQDS